jgi:Protein of unknown function (DUF3500)
MIAQDKPWLYGILALTSSILIACVTQSGATAAANLPTTSNADATTKKIVAAANAFEATLTDAQKTKVNFAWGDTTQRAKWSNFPTGIFQRNGLKLGDMTNAQKTATFALLESVLSPSGYKQIRQVIDGDEVLKTSGGGGNLTFGEAQYYISFVGTPSETTPWTLQFGGHHMALNATVFGKDVVLTPSLTGGQPTTYTLNGVTVQPIIGEVTRAFALINSLDATQQKQAIIGSRFIDLVLGPGQDGKTLQPEGIPASSLNDSQKAALFALIAERVSILDEDDATAKLTEVKANLEKTYFAWAGPTAAGSAAYFRVTGPTVLIEYSPQSMGGDASNHVHSMLRDPTNDYGAAIIK